MFHVPLRTSHTIMQTSSIYFMRGPSINSFCYNYDGCSERSGTCLECRLRWWQLCKYHILPTGFSALLPSSWQLPEGYSRPVLQDVHTDSWALLCKLLLLQNWPGIFTQKQYFLCWCIFLLFLDFPTKNVWGCHSKWYCCPLKKSTAFHHQDALHVSEDCGCLLASRESCPKCSGTWAYVMLQVNGLLLVLCHDLQSIVWM